MFGHMTLKRVTIAVNYSADGTNVDTAHRFD